MGIGRDRGRVVGLHEVRVMGDGGGQSAEHHAARLEIVPDCPIRGFGFLERPEAGKEARFTDLGDGCARDSLRPDHPIEIDVPQERGPRRHPVGMQSLQGSEPQAQHPLGLAARFRELADEVGARSRTDGHGTARLLLGGGPGSVQRHDTHSSETVSCFLSRAASRVCQARLAHFTRTGNSQTPDRTASLPREVSTGSPGRAVTILWNRSKRRWASAFDLPFTASVISDAEAFEIAHPWPTNDMSSIVPCRGARTRSPGPRTAGCGPRPSRWRPRSPGNYGASYCDPGSYPGTALGDPASGGLPQGCAGPGR